MGCHHLSIQQALLINYYNFLTIFIRRSRVRYLAHKKTVPHSAQNTFKGGHSARCREQRPSYVHQVNTASPVEFRHRIPRFSKVPLAAAVAALEL